MRVEYLISRAPGLGSLSGHVLLALGQKGLWIRKARPRFLRFHETTVRQGEGEEITLRCGESSMERVFYPKSNNDSRSWSKNSGNFLNCQDKHWRYFLDLLCLYDKRYTMKIFSNFSWWYWKLALLSSLFYYLFAVFELLFRGKVAIIFLKLLPPFPGSDWTLSSNFPKTFTELR